VDDPEQLTRLLENGIGPAKSFGCGLLLVRRLG
jgi:CRISPR system Cascade subunit CasE